MPQRIILVPDPELVPGRFWKWLEPLGAGILKGLGFVISLGVTGYVIVQIADRYDPARKQNKEAQAKVTESCISNSSLICSLFLLTGWIDDH
jgi:hypothetical protein